MSDAGKVLGWWWWESCPDICKAGPAWEGVLQPNCSLFLLMQG